MTTTQFFTADTELRDLDDSPIHGPHVIAGAPVARASRLTESADRRVSTHLWDCTAGTFHWVFGVDEIVHILEGEVHVTDEQGRTATLRAGDVGHFPYGSRTVWDVPNYVRKFAVHRAPSVDGSLARRAARKAKRLLVPTGAVIAAPVVCSLPV